ncbi:MAG: class B sortase [Clostridia bacterium]
MKKLLFWLCAIVFVIAIANIGSEISVRLKDASVYEELAEQVESFVPLENVTQDENSITYSSDDIIIEQEILAKYQSLYEQNNDLVGWIKIEDTELNYPVMQTPDDPEYYLRKDFYGAYSISGTPFLGSNCSISPSSVNMVIYGHHMRDESIFTAVSYYISYSYYEEHKYISFDTLYEENTYEVVYAFYIDVTPDNGHFEFYNYINFTTDEQFEEFKTNCETLSIYDTGVQIENGDEFLTLVTCSYGSDNERTVVIAKKIS